MAVLLKSILIAKFLGAAGTALRSRRVAAADLTASTTPVHKVIEMLTDMKANGQAEMQTEMEVYEKYAKFVRLRSQELSHEIGEAKAQANKLVASISKAESDVEELGGKVQALEAESDKMEGQTKAATELRDTEHKEFVEDQSSYTESLYALDRAIQLLHAQNYDRAQVAALLQREVRTTRGMSRVLASLELLQMGDASHDLPAGAPAVAAYEFQSGDVLEMLKKLRLRFKDELGELQKREMNGQQAYDLEMLHTNNLLANLKAEHEALVGARASAASSAARDKGHLADTRASLAEDEKFLRDLHSTFEVRESTFQVNQKVRQEELEAIAKAIEVMSSPEVVGAYADHVESLAQAPNSGVMAMLQTRRASRRGAAKERVAGLLAARAKALGSRELSALAARVAANPFAKVIDMIESLLERLKSEAASEAEHKAFCDEELRKNKLKREEFESVAARLLSEIDGKAADIAEMGKDMGALAEEQAALRKAIAEATDQRQKEKAANAVAIKDSREAGKAVKKALIVLRDYYAGAQLLQVSRARAKGRRKQLQVPEMAAYAGMRGSSGGVIGMLEVIQSDFARVEADTMAAETQAVSAYQVFTRDSEEALQAKHQREFKLRLELDQTEFDKSRLEKDLGLAQEQLSAAKAYFQELTPQCVIVHVSFEERSARRHEEIEALKEAYRLLDSKQ